MINQRRDDMYAHPANSQPLLTSLHNYSSREEQEDLRRRVHWSLRLFSFALLQTSPYLHIGYEKILTLLNSKIVETCHFSKQTSRHHPSFYMSLSLVTYPRLAFCKCLKSAAFKSTPFPQSIISDKFATYEEH